LVLKRFLLLLLDRNQNPVQPRQFELLFAIDLAVMRHRLGQGVYRGAVIGHTSGERVKVLDNASRNPESHRCWRDVLGDDAPGSDHRTITNGDTAPDHISTCSVPYMATTAVNLQDGDVGAKPYMIANRDGLPDAILLLGSLIGAQRVADTHNAAVGPDVASFADNDISHWRVHDLAVAVDKS
jgi:hypothetical protein